MTSLVKQPTVTLPGNVQMPMVGFGTWHVTGRGGYDSIRYALDVGYRLLDTATMYNNEDVVGRAVRDSGLPREEVFITTKLLPEQVGQEREALGESLAALGVDYVDLWLIHWPPARDAGVRVWREFLAARDEGLARAIGVSNYDIREIDELIDATGETPAVNQIRWSPSLHDPVRLAENRRRGVVVEGYSPFKSTDLDDPVLGRIAAAHGVSAAQVVLRWHLEHEVVVIPKSVTPERIAANFDIFDFSLSDEEVRQIDSLGG
ncbi:MAG TPA: aldo/keto reductase [Micromonosporaceae bacterium]|nr:aldo/keto reductase [Micromonosporaceae bacterium]